MRFKNILYRSLAVLLSGFCMIVMNLSLSDTAPEPYMTEVQEMEKGGSSLFQSWAFYAEMLLIFYLSCVAWPAYPLFCRETDVSTSFNL